MHSAALRSRRPHGRRWVDASAAAVAAAPQGKPFPRAREADFAFRVLPPAGAPAAAGSPQQDGRAPPRAQRYPPCSCAGIGGVEAEDARSLALQPLQQLSDWHTAFPRVPSDVGSFPHPVSDACLEGGVMMWPPVHLCLHSVKHSAARRLACGSEFAVAGRAGRLEVWPWEEAGLAQPRSRSTSRGSARSRSRSGERAAAGQPGRAARGAARAPAAGPGRGRGRGRGRRGAAAAAGAATSAALAPAAPEVEAVAIEDAPATPPAEPGPPEAAAGGSAKRGARKRAAGAPVHMQRWSSRWRCTA